MQKNFKKLLLFSNKCDIIFGYDRYVCLGLAENAMFGGLKQW
jgi:hypothetical protein